MDMEYTKIQISHKQQIEQIRKNTGNILLSHSFYTLFLWQETMKLSIYLEEDFFVVKYRLKGENSYFCPCGNKEKILNWIQTNCENKELRLFYVDEASKEMIEERFKGFFKFEYDSGSYEYIYDRLEHILKKGKKYQRIRREINHLASNYTLRTEILTKKNLSVSRTVVEGWNKNYIEEKSNMTMEDISVAESAIKNFSELGLLGVLVYVDEKPMATAIGCEITNDTYGIQVAKMCEKKEGLMFYLLEQMFKVIPNQYTYVNGDDDMNIEGIRIHKQKMKPVRMNEVWKVESRL